MSPNYTVKVNSPQNFKVNYSQQSTFDFRTAINVIGGIGSLTQLQVNGISTFTNGPVLIGSGTSTGTSSQPLQVFGGAYVSVSVGIGTTTPTQPLDVVGNVKFRSGIYDKNSNVGGIGSIITADGNGGWGWKPVTAIASAIDFTQSGTGAVTRTVDSKLKDTISLKDFGAVGDGVTNDTSSVTNALTAGVSYIPSGSYLTTIGSQSGLTGKGFGPGKIITNDGNKSAGYFSIISSAPSSAGNENSIDTAFNGDYSKCQFPIAHRITGTDTLGQPSTGYLYRPEAMPNYTYLYNSSGWNQSTSGNDGRTGVAAYRAKVAQYGQGDAVCFNGSVFVTGTKTGSTSFLSNPAGVLFNGDMQSGADGVYLNPYETYCRDSGYDVACVGLVNNFNRSNSTGAKGVYWLGYRAQSVGVATCDALISATGKWVTGIDLSMTGLDFGTTKAAISLKGNDRVYFNNAAVASGNLTGDIRTTAFNGDYMEYNTSGSFIHIVRGGSSKLQVGSSYVVVANSSLLVNPTGSSGSVGIGTASPQAILHVVGNTLFDGAITATTFNGNLTGTATNVIGGIGSLTSLTVSGLSTFTNGPVLIGTGTSTGTVGQPLQVNGKAYFANSVGINSTNPTAALDVIGVAKIGTATTYTTIGSDLGRNIELGIGATTLDTYIDFQGSATYSDYAARLVRTAGDNSNFNIINRGTGSLRLVTQDAGPIDFLTINTLRHRINSDGIFLVGAGTSTGTASQPLQVSGSAYVSGNLGIGETNPSTLKLSVNGDVRFYSSGQGDVTISHSSLVSSIKAQSSVQLALGANNAEAIRINTSNQVGIGTTNPVSTLQVKDALAFETVNTTTTTTTQVAVDTFPVATFRSAKYQVQITCPGQIATLGGITTGGSGYTAGTFNVTFSNSSGNGSTAQGTLTISNGTVAQIGVTSGGSGYIAGDVLTAGGGSGLQVSVGSTAAVTGAILTLGAITSAGIGYTAGVGVGTTSLTFLGGTGTGAVGLATILDGVITSSTLLQQPTTGTGGTVYYAGSNYSTATVLTIAKTEVTNTITDIVGSVGVSTFTSLTAHGIGVSDAIRVSSTSNGLTAGTDYYVVSTPTSTTFTLGSSVGVGTTFTTGSGLAIAFYRNSAIAGGSVAYLNAITGVSTNYQVSDLMVLQDGRVADYVEYGTIANTDILGTFVADISGTNARLLLTPTYPNNTVKVVRQAITV